MRLSPDGRRLAMTVPTLTAVGLFVYDLERGTIAPVVKEGETGTMAWSPDGLRLAFAWLSNGRRSLAAASVDGTTPPALLAAGNFDPSSWMPDGLHLAAVQDNADIVSVTAGQGNATVQPLIRTSDMEASPEFSPDGHWLAYVSNVSGRFEVYVRPYPGPGLAEQVSIEGGTSPAWHPSGRELFFVGLPDAAEKMSLLAVDFIPGSPPRIGRPRPLITIQSDLDFGTLPVRAYDVARDGQHFYAIRYRIPPQAPPVTHINLLQNWFEELKAKVPSDPGK